MLNLDLTGLNCPLPVLKTKKFLAQLNSGAIIKILTTDPASTADLREFCHKTGHTLQSQEQHINYICTIIKKR